ncbi:MAG: class I SAM-dependent methyltransferase [Chloroflexota bacterium]
MKATAAVRLLALNREFYERFGADFSSTRRRLQPGVTRILGTLRGGESILDLGCGNGALARTLSRRGHRGPYLGLDFSLSLLREADFSSGAFPVHFLQADLASKEWSKGVRGQGFNLITCFATLHHIPGQSARLSICKTVHDLLAEDGRFVLSNWQFLNSPRLRARVQPWERIGLKAEDVDEGDYLLDWRRGGEGLRYVHQFNEEELMQLAAESGFEVVESFYSDGEGSRLGLYQIWKSK